MPNAISLKSKRYLEKCCQKGLIFSREVQEWKFVWYSSLSRLEDKIVLEEESFWNYKCILVFCALFSFYSYLSFLVEFHSERKTAISDPCMSMQLDKILVRDGHFFGSCLHASSNNVIPAYAQSYIPSTFYWGRGMPKMDLTCTIFLL